MMERFCLTVGCIANGKRYEVGESLYVECNNW